MSVEIGDIVAGQYRLEELLGKGGMGAVYLATHVGLAEKVAVKVVQLPPGSEGSESIFWERFRREARVAFQLRHEHAVRVIDFGEDEGTPYLVMEFLDGRPLSSDLGSGKPLEPLDRATEIAVALADVLVEMHRQSLVHRDLKPDNVILIETESSERPVIVDFGLAYLMDSETLGRVTKGGEVAGTPHYIAPEQGRGASRIGPAADVYAFGCLLFEMLAGRVPFPEGSPAELVGKHMFVPAPALGEVRGAEHGPVPEELAELVAAMLEKEPADRPTSEEVYQRLGRIHHGEREWKRGRPKRYLQERSDRAVDGERDGGESGEAQAIVVGIVGEIDDEWRMSLGAAGHRVETIEAGGSVAESGEVDVVFVPEADVEAVERVEALGPVLAGCDPADFERSTALLQTAAVDVLTRPIEASKLVEKVERVWRKGRRRE